MYARTGRPRSRRIPFLAILLSAGVLLPATPAAAIVGGGPAPEGRWPWMAGLLEASLEDAGAAQFCGGVVIAPRRILTAGHCAIDESPEEVEVLVGRTRLRGSGGRRIPVKAISVYPGFASGRTKGLDAAVMELAADAAVAPLALARPGQDAAWAPGTEAWTLGWGQLNARTSPGGNRYFADRLRELQEPIQGDDACEGVFGIGWPDLPYRPEWLLCAGQANDRAGSCYGDSGAPLVVAGPDGWLDVGIDIAGDACATPGYYDLNVRVDRISGFALQPHPVAQPDLVAAPRISGRLRPGRHVRCGTGRWRNQPTSFTVRWRRLGTHRTVGRGRGHRVDRRDAAAGLACTVTGRNRGGWMRATARRAATRAHH